MNFSNIRRRRMNPLANRVIALFGDSIASQNNGAANRNEAYGFFTNASAMSGQRYIQDFSTNKGLGGDDAAESLARVDDLDAVEPNDVVISLGANDFGTTTGAFRDPDDFISDISDIKDYCLNVLEAERVWMYSVPPSDDNSVDQTNARIEANTKLLDLVDNHFILIDVWDLLSDGSGNYKTGYSHDGVHINMIGAAVQGDPLHAAMNAYYGSRSFGVHLNNVLINPSMLGVGGTVSGSIFAGELADDFATSGSGGSSADATLSKDNDNKQIIDFSSSVVATLSRRIQHTYTASDIVGKTCYYEMEVEVLEANTGTGLWKTMSCEIRNSGSLAIGFDRQGSTDAIADTQLISFHNKTRRNLIIRSPEIVAPDPTTSLTGRLNLEFVNTAGQSCNAKVKIHNAQLVVMD